MNLFGLLLQAFLLPLLTSCLSYTIHSLWNSIILNPEYLLHLPVLPFLSFTLSAAYPYHSSSTCNVWFHGCTSSLICFTFPGSLCFSFCRASSLKGLSLCLHWYQWLALVIVCILFRVWGGAWIYSHASVGTDYSFILYLLFISPNIIFHSSQLFFHTIKLLDGTMPYSLFLPFFPTNNLITSPVKFWKQSTFILSLSMVLLYSVIYASSERITNHKSQLLTNWNKLYISCFVIKHIALVDIKKNVFWNFSIPLLSKFLVHISLTT